MQSKLYVVAAVLMMLFLVSCTPSISQNNPASAPSSGTQWGSIQPSSRVKVPTANSKSSTEIQDLIDKNQNATNYYYYFFDSVHGQGYIVSAVGSKVKKVYDDSFHLRGDIFYTTVYLDTTAQTAFAACDQVISSCSPSWKKAYPVDYDMYKIGPTPVQIIQQVHDPQKVGSEVMLNRDLTLIEYINPFGKTETLSIDNYYGLPSRQIVYSIAEDEEIEQSNTFTKLSVGQLKEKDVTLPVDYVVQK